MASTRLKGMTLVVHVPESSTETGKIVKGEQFVFGKTLCGECEARLADWLEEVTCLKCLEMLDKKNDKKPDTRRHRRRGGEENKRE